MEQLAWSDGSKPLRSLKEDRMKYLGAVDSNDFQDAKVSHDNKNVSGRCLSRYVHMCMQIVHVSMATTQMYVNAFV